MAVIAAICTRRLHLHACEGDWHLIDMQGMCVVTVVIKRVSLCLNAALDADMLL